MLENWIELFWPPCLAQSPSDTQKKILKREHGNTDERMSFRLIFFRSSLHMNMHVCGIYYQVVNKWQHRKLVKVGCPHVLGKQYCCGIKFNNFLSSTSNPNGFRIVVLCYLIIACTCNFWSTVEFTWNCTEIQNLDDVMSDPCCLVCHFLRAPPLACTFSSLSG